MSARAGRDFNTLHGRESERGHGNRGRNSALRADVFAHGVRANDWTHRENGAGEEGNRAGSCGSMRRADVSLSDSVEKRRGDSAWELCTDTLVLVSNSVGSSGVGDRNAAQ